MITTVDPLLALAWNLQDETKSLLRSLVEIESPSGEDAALARFVAALTGHCEGLARVTLEGQSLIAEFDLPGSEPQGSEPQGHVLLLAHSDTVWPMNTLARMPWRETADRWFGPGVLDIKAGIVMALQAARILRESGTVVRRRVTLLVVPDEETGSKTSRPLTERLARDSDLVLVLEPGTGIEGKLKTARKGIADYRIQVQGVASHSGVDFEKGASAIVELARQIPILAEWSGEGVTVNPGVVRGGTRTNVVAAEAELMLDVRVPTLAAFERIDARIRGLRPHDPRCRIGVSGQLNRPPMERTPAIAQWFETARRLALDLGVSLEESSTGGGSDGNFTAALGVPTLDGLGAVGEGAHAPHESVLHARLPDRIALLAKLLAAA
jgi:glutamate carboxypeptidase